MLLFVWLIPCFKKRARITNCRLTVYVFALLHSIGCSERESPVGCSVFGRAMIRTVESLYLLTLSKGVLLVLMALLVVVLMVDLYLVQLLKEWVPILFSFFVRRAKKRNGLCPQIEPRRFPFSIAAK